MANNYSGATPQSKQNFPLALIGGIIAGLVCALIWAAVSVATGYQIGYMAVGVGFVVGIVIRFLGKGTAPAFGYMGAVIAIVSCVIGNLLCIVGFLSEGNYIEAITSFDYSQSLTVLIEYFDVIDVLFYVLAAGAGYRFSFHKEKHEEQELQVAPVSISDDSQGNEGIDNEEEDEE